MSVTKNKQDQKQKVSGITSITIEGFKSLREKSHLEIRPLTILSGANSSGKSSILQPLLLLKQTLEASYDPGPLLLYGPNVQHTAANQFLSRISPNKQVGRFILSIEENNREERNKLTTVYKKKDGDDIVIESMQHVGTDSVVTLKPHMSEKELLQELPNFKKVLTTFSELEKFNASVDINRDRCFLNAEISFNLEKKSGATTILGVNPAESFSVHIRRLIHVPGLRGNPTRTYKTTAFGSVFPGTFENYVASIVLYWQKTNDERLKRLEEFLFVLGLTQQIDAKQLDDTQVELRIGRLSDGSNNKDMVNIADVGLGVSQILPVLVAVLTAEPSQLIYIEQPEIHLHPKAQASLAKILVKEANRGVRIIVETHSALLLTAIQTCVVNDDIDKNDLILHWFQRDFTGFSKISTTDIDKYGAFGDWPEDFAEVSLDVEGKYLEAVESRLWEEENA